MMSLTMVWASIPSYNPNPQDPDGPPDRKPWETSMRPNVQYRTIASLRAGSRSLP